MGLLLRVGEEKGRRRKVEGKEGDGNGKKGRDHHGLQPPKSKFSGYVAANVQFLPRDAMHPRY